MLSSTAKHGVAIVTIHWVGIVFLTITTSIFTRIQYRRYGHDVQKMLKNKFVTRTLVACVALILCEILDVLWLVYDQFDLDPPHRASKLGGTLLYIIAAWFIFVSLLAHISLVYSRSAEIIATSQQPRLKLLLTVLLRMSWIFGVASMVFRLYLLMPPTSPLAKVTNAAYTVASLVFAVCLSFIDALCTYQFWKYVREHQKAYSNKQDKASHVIAQVGFKICCASLVVMLAYVTRRSFTEVVAGEWAYLVVAYASLAAVNLWMLMKVRVDEVLMAGDSGIQSDQTSHPDQHKKLDGQSEDGRMSSDDFHMKNTAPSEVDGPTMTDNTVQSVPVPVNSV